MSPAFPMPDHEGDQGSAPVTGLEIAIVGLAGRFPGAADIDALWRNITGGVESVTRFDDAALRAMGVPESLLADPSYVRAQAELPGMDLFDAAFFGCSPREAEQLDPQQRIFLETAWQALEHAGHAGAGRPASTALFAGSGANLYLLRHLLPRHGLGDAGDIASLLGLLNGNDKDSLATRTAYKLDLRGPAVSVQTACSTSLVAVHLACRSLLNHESDLALAGGVWLNLLQGRGGYRHQAGAILSADGHCRAFDAGASGTLIGSGAGVVVLRRLADALADGDTVHAVIKGSALNNDGAHKAGFTAPSVDGQAEVIRAALAMAEVPADSIGLVEAHGTGTVLGDPIEVAALAQAHADGAPVRPGRCAIGSVKTNIGHLDAASGVTGLIKAVLALTHRVLPPSLNYERPNPEIDFGGTPFYVNTQTRDWPRGPSPRRAGVSSFGMGGTNVHVVVEEAPPPNALPADPVPEALRTLVLSARTRSALDQAVERLAEHLEAHPGQDIADVAHTLRHGRKHFEHRATALVHGRLDAAEVLRGRGSASFFQGQAPAHRPLVAFLFPGQGAQHVDMGRSLYESEPGFRDTVDRCCTVLGPELGFDLRSLLHPGEEAMAAQAAARLGHTAATQPALFVIEYAMARFWIDLGVTPDAMLGHSIGEYVAACVAGVFSLEDALKLVAARGRLLQATPPGAMLAVNLGVSQLQEALGDGCDLAAINADDLCVLSGPEDAIARARARFARQGAGFRRLQVSHAFHSACVEPMLAEFEALVAGLRLSAPRIPFVSNLSGRWITPEEACSPAYWSRHVRGTVRFADGLSTLFEQEGRVLLEVGPGETLSRLARKHPQAGRSHGILASQCHPDRRARNAQQVQRCAAQLWTLGVEAKAAPEAGRRRVPLPTYPFERKSYWVDLPLAEDGSAPVRTGMAHGAPLLDAITASSTATASSAQDALAAGDAPLDVPDWFHVPIWKRTEPLASSAAVKAPGVSRGVLLMDRGTSFGDALARRLAESGRRVIHVEPGEAPGRIAPDRHAVRLGDAGDLEAVLRAAAANDVAIEEVCHLWNLDEAGLPANADADAVLALGLHSLFALAQALKAVGARHRTALTVVANQVEDVDGIAPLCPHKATLHGPCKVLPQENPGLTCRLVDVLPPPPGDGPAEERLARQIVAEMDGDGSDDVVALRGPHRMARSFEPVRRDAPVASLLREGGVYLITGGLGGVGLVLARHLARRWKACLVLTARTALPPRDSWERLLRDGTAAAPRATLLRELLSLESEAGGLLVLQADVGSASRMAEVVREATQRFGRIDGAVHAAGDAGGKSIGGGSRAELERVLAPKLRGTQVLMSVLAGRPLDFILLCSSLASLAGGIGKAGYAAANAFLDARAAQAQREGGPRVISVSWDGWRDLGMAAGQRLPAHVGIDAQRGVDAFERILAGPDTAHVIVSTTALGPRLAATGENLLDVLAQQHAVPPQARDGAAPRRIHPRPDLPTPFVAPEGELERSLADIWHQLLGIQGIGAHDRLFELGGDSLLAIQVLARVRSRHGVELHPSVLFDAPTIAALAAQVESRLIEQLEDEDEEDESEDLPAAPAPVLAPAIP